jgi:hypothetical protein
VPAEDAAQRRETAPNRGRLHHLMEKAR